MREQFSRHKRQIAGDNDGPFARARRERGMNAAERAPTRIHIRHGRKSRMRLARVDERDRVRDLAECGRDPIDKSLIFDEKLSFVSAHTARLATGEDEALEL